MATTLGGIILCGGRSTRMGQSKAWLPFGNETLLQRVVRIVGDACVPVVVVAAPGQELPPLPAGVGIARDAVDGEGPIAGLLAGLEFLGDRAEAAFVTACDMPFLTAEFILKIREELTSASSIAVPYVDGFFHPLAAVYRTSILSTLLRFYESGERKLQKLFELVPTVRVTPSDVRPLKNMNTPEDYADSIS